MSISCSPLRQIVPPSTRSSGDEFTKVSFDSSDISSSSVDSLLASDRDDLDFRIRQRLEASRQGMLQLEALRSKHQKLMQSSILWDLKLTLSMNYLSSASAIVCYRIKEDEDLFFTDVELMLKEMRIRLPQKTDKEQLHENIEKHKEPPVINSQNEMKSNELRCDSPVSCCVSHRSSISMDSGCVSLSSDLSNQSPMPCNGNQKFSLEDHRKKTEQKMAITEDESDENPLLVAMVIESTTALRCHGKKCYNCPRPKSLCSSHPDENAVVDSLSFSQITPPPIHRKFFTVGRSESVQTRRPCLAKSCTDIHSPTPLQREQSPARFPVNQSSVVHAKPITVSLSSKIPAPSYMRLRDSQTVVHNSRVVTHPDNQSIFHASRIFVDRSPRIVQCPKQCTNIERYDSDEESPRLLRAQPAVVLSRQQSYAHSNESSPCELRKVHLIESSNSLSNCAVFGCHQQLSRCESSQSSETIVSDKPRRRKKEKDWKESEDL
uniref:Uncharacterized protein n=1 Tax=Setaria digitata TaxID=48799 RepID=A0A915PJF2_9BILA